jgi:hypothetical protein
MSKQLHSAIMHELITAEGLDDIRIKAADSFDRHGCISLHWIPKDEKARQTMLAVLDIVARRCQRKNDLARVQHAQVRLLRLAQRKGGEIS